MCTGQIIPDRDSEDLLREDYVNRRDAELTGLGFTVGAERCLVAHGEGHRRSIAFPGHGRVAGSLGRGDGSGVDGDGSIAEFVVAR